MKVDKEEYPRIGRVRVVYGIIFLALSSLIMRLGYLQIARGSDFRVQAHTTMLSRMSVLPSRGWIYDTNGVLLAYSKPSFSISITRLSSHEQDFDDIAKTLAPVLRMTPKSFLGLLNNSTNKNQSQIELYDNANEQQVTFVREHQSDLPGVQVEVVPQRVYKYGGLAGQVLGYVGNQSDRDRPQYAAKHYDIHQLVGKDGVELQYESLLQGQPGYRMVEINTLGIPIRDLGLDPAPTAGNTLQLTIDSTLQAYAQQIVLDTLKEVHDKHHYNPKEASAVLMNPKDGSILALVSYPYYNPQWFMDQKILQKHLDYVWDPVLTPTLNHVIASRHPPGSTVKPVNLLAALTQGVITPNTTISDPGYAMVGTYRAKDDNLSGHGQVDPVKALQVSCDTFFYHVGMWLADWWGGPPAGQTVTEWLWRGHVKGLNTLFHWETLFGLGTRTGIDLPGEALGSFFQDDANKGRAIPYKLDEAMRAIHTQGYYQNNSVLYDNAAAAIGQMQEFTPIQLAQYVSTLANGGRRIQPHVLKTVYPPGVDPAKDAKGQMVQPTVLGTINIQRQYLHIVKRGMYDVVNTPGGTAYGSFYNAPYKAAGKTGTAQVGRGTEDTSVFMAYAPADNPEVAVAVMIPGGGSSYDTAVPIARQLLDVYFKEHHASFFPQREWIEPTGPPLNWFQMSAYLETEAAVGTSPKSSKK
jgi:penicillin-binding protein 2